MVHEQTIEQERRFEQLQKERSGPSIWSKLSFAQLSIIILAIATGAFYLISGGTKIEYVYFIVIVIALMVLASSKKGPERKLSEEEARAIAYNWIVRNQRAVPGFQQGTPLMPGPGKEHSFQGEPQYYEFYVQIIDLDYQAHKYSIAVYSKGDWIAHIKHFRPREQGWSGEECPDLIREYIPAPRGYINPIVENFRKLNVR